MYEAITVKPSPEAAMWRPTGGDVDIVPTGDSLSTDADSYFRSHKYIATLEGYGRRTSKITKAMGKPEMDSSREKSLSVKERNVLSLLGRVRS